MEWLSCIRKTIDLIESNLKSNMGVKEIAAKVGVSVFFLQKGFSVLTGYSIGEYTRNRKLYQAALDLQSTDKQIIDIALDYGCETPESFTKAFSRFHDNGFCVYPAHHVCLKQGYPKIVRSKNLHIVAKNLVTTIFI